MGLTAGHKTLLRSESQYSILGLAVLQPRTILACQISDYTGTDMVSEFLFGSVTEGSYADVLPGMIVFVGSSAGAYDVGICRARKAWTADTAYTSEESSIAFANDLYITVVDAFDIRPKHLVVTAEEVFMDVDVDYSDQHENFDPIPVMGGHVVLDVDSYPATVTFPSVADSWVFDSTISTYLFEASEGVVTDETTTNPTLTISSYPTNGYIRVSLTVTAANGKSFTGHRYVIIFDADNRPITDFTLDECGCSIDDGDWSARVTLNDVNDIDTLRFGGLAVIFSKDYFDGQEDVVGLYPGRENIWMSGWIYESSMVDDPEFKPSSFDIKGAAFWMSRMSSFPVGVEITTSTATVWTEMENLTVDKGLYHFLHWRTTVTQIMDVYLTDDTKYTGSTESAAGNIWDQILDIAGSQILARAACDHNMLFAVKVPYNLIPSASRAANSELVIALEDQDYSKQVEITKRAPQVSQVLLSGVAADEFGNGTAIYSLSPGHVPALLGSLLPFPNVLLSDQDQSNKLAGLVFAHENNPYPEIPLTLTGANRAFDIAPTLYGTIAGLDEYTGTIVPISIDLSYEYDPGDLTRVGGKCIVEVVFESETDESDAIYIDGDIPDSNGGFVSIPSLGKLPPLDPLDLPDIPLFPSSYPSTNTDCGSEYKNFYPLVWSKPYLDGSDSTKLISNAYFPCKVRSNPRTQTFIDFNVQFYGDASTNFTVYAVYGGSRVLTGRLAVGIGTYAFRAYFDVVSDTLIDGFEIELNSSGSGWTGGPATLTPSGEFVCTSTQVNAFTVAVQEVTTGGNYGLDITASAECTVHVWLPPGFIGRISKPTSYTPSTLNWIYNYQAADHQGLVDGLWVADGLRNPPFNPWYKYVASGWTEIISFTLPAGKDSGQRLTNGIGATSGGNIEYDYNMPYYIIAGEQSSDERVMYIYNSVLNNVCSPS